MRNATVTSTSIVADGRHRALTAVGDQLRARANAVVLRAYRPHLARAGAFGKFWLKLRLRHAVRRRIRHKSDQHAPPWALYLRG